MPFHSFLGEGSPTKIDYRKKGALILTSLLENLGMYSTETCLVLFTASSVGQISSFDKPTRETCWGEWQTPSCADQ